ncbi:transketolase [Diaphorobacter aerolatus]|uniref:Transketolase n=1 Tax=Diaphorobacter aerolatus TaxID=1288495 RepID=A0A7H0GMH8_9BURK|nr:transketolase [Diaphorobacter aerolatus]QNP49494.1 transketolase [Diaphorobacter aerolatus]
MNTNAFPIPWQQRDRLALPVAELRKVAHALRRQVIKLVRRHGQGYVQQGLGAAEIFASLYFNDARIDPAHPRWEERDRCILSTAHNSALFHAALALRGMIPAELLDDYIKDGSALEINVSERLGPVVEGTFGSLGQGLSVAAGMAAASRISGVDYRVNVILGDGELEEGQVWEAAMFAGSQRLNNLCVILDLNWMQVEGHTDDVLRLAPIADKWLAFGWNVIELDGHDLCALLKAFADARAETTKPTIIVATTVPGKGVSLLEGIISHNAKLPAEVADAALEELGEIA